MKKETFTYSKFEVREKTPSNIRKGHFHSVEVGVKCPRCEEICDTIEHGETKWCGGCGLKMQRYGNALQCWGEDWRITKRAENVKSKFVDLMREYLMRELGIQVSETGE